MFSDLLISLTAVSLLVCLCQELECASLIGRVVSCEMINNACHWFVSFPGCRSSDAKARKDALNQIDT